jgi:hypothetical protein
MPFAALALSSGNVHATVTNETLIPQRSQARIRDSGSWPHHEIDYLAPPASRDAHAADAYIGSPSIIDLKGDGWLASHDRFFDEQVGTAYIFGAASPATSWTLRATVSPMYWAQLFVNDGVPKPAVYLIGTSDDMSGRGDVVISRCIRTSSSLCSGTNWTKPAVLFAGSSSTKFHAAPTPVVTTYDEKSEAVRLRAFDVVRTPGSELSVVMLSAYAQCPDLTLATCWRMSDALRWDPTWLPSAHSSGFAWEEAGAIVDAGGNVSVMVRIDGALEGCVDLASCNRAVLLRYDVPTRTLSFRAIVPLPSGSNKFKVARRPDAEQTSEFYALTNPVTQVPASSFPPGNGQRSLLVLAHSTDLVSWQSCAPVAFDDTNVRAPLPSISSGRMARAPLTTCRALPRLSRPSSAPLPRLSCALCRGRSSPYPTLYSTRASSTSIGSTTATTSSRQCVLATAALSHTTMRTGSSSRGSQLSPSYARRPSPAVASPSTCSVTASRHLQTEATRGAVCHPRSGACRWLAPSGGRLPLPTSRSGWDGRRRSTWGCARASPATWPHLDGSGPSWPSATAMPQARK